MFTITPNIIKLKVPDSRPPYFLIALSLRKTRLERGLPTRKWLVTLRRAQSRVVPPVREVCHRHPQQTADGHIVHIMTVIFTSADGNERSAKERNSAQENTAEIRAWPEDVHLPAQKQAEVAKAAESKGGVARRERAPAIVEGM